MIMRILLRVLAVLLMYMPAAAWAQDPQAMIRAWELSGGQERILSFVSDVSIEPDGDLDVTETIHLVSLRQEINHGIQRDFPTSYSKGADQRTRVGFAVVSVRRDGHDEPWEQMSLSNGERIRIGSADVELPLGEHTFVIRYRTTRQILYGEAHDELYWNVTGTGWTFPIDMAEARIRLPAEAAFGDRAAYTGPQGSTARNAQVIAERPGLIVFRTTAPLGREEGLTVAAAFPKGVLQAPDAVRRATWWLEDWGALAAAALASLAVAGYFVRAWWKVGRGPQQGTIVPVFSPPAGLTPAAVRYISKMEFDDRAFSAALVYLGERRRLHIAQEKDGWLSKGSTTLTRTDVPDAGGDGQLAAPEQAALDKLFAGRTSIELKQTNHATISAARTRLGTGLGEAYEGTMFRKNSGWAAFGLLLVPLAMLAAALVALIADPAVSGWERAGLPLMAVLLIAGALALHRAAPRKGRGWLAWLAVTVLSLGAIAATFVTIGAALSAGAFAVLVPLLLLPLAISAFWWMAAPTPEGRVMMDRIAGFKQYLSITEEARLDALHPPEKTPELFERYLPYAIALDVENRWADRFASVLAAAAAAGATAQTASWYSGHGNLWDNPSGFASDLGSSFASTVSSAATSPSSSSGGSSGGGSSGGGGGGGGGSGW